MPISAGISALGTVASAGIQMYGQSQAVDAQRDATSKALALQQQQYQQNTSNLAPWMSGGQGAFNLQQYLTGTGTDKGAYGGPLTQGSLIAPFAPTLAQLKQTPGYQFTLDQGLKATQNSYASKGLGSSGAAMKGAADYAGGVAANTYQQQFQNYWGQNQSIYNMLTGQSGQGLQAAAALTGNNTGLTNNMASNITGFGNAAAAGYNAMGNTAGNAISGAANTYGSYNLLSSLLGRSNGTNNVSSPVSTSNPTANWYDFPGSTTNPIQGWGSG